MGPLRGIRIVELAGIGPGPFCCMMLADHGAEVIRVERPGTPPAPATEVLSRSRETVALDLKHPADVEALKRLVADADALIEGFRPGTIERLGLGPDVLLALNPGLVIGRMTGWGQTGPYAPFAGHDINYISLSGALHAIGPKERPVPPLALAGDFGGGGMLLAFAVTAALLHARITGEGQVIDCAMTEGSALLMAAFYGLHSGGEWQDRRGVNLLDGGAHFYGAYETADGKFVSIGPLEPQFYAVLLDRLELGDDAAFRAQMEVGNWPALRPRLEAVFRTRTRDEWCDLLEHCDACFAPVLSLAEAPGHAHAAARAAFVVLDGVVQPAPAPRYSRTETAPPRLSRSTTPDELASRRPGGTL